MKLNSKGVTLMELLIVIVILGVIAAISMVAVGRIVENTRWRSVEANVTRLEGAVRIYKIMGDDFNNNVQDVLIAYGYTAPPTNNANLNLTQWEDYAKALLGNYVETWPTLPNGGVFSYRYSNDLASTADSLRRITLNNLSSTRNERMRNVLFSDGVPEPDGHFIMIRFDNSEDFIETATFLLEQTKYQYIFSWASQDNIWIYVP